MSIRYCRWVSDDFRPISKIHDVVALHPKQHGWERFGMNNDDEVTLAPFTEGAYMTKHDGKYYLQYGAPGTEFKVYADGVYVSDNPAGRPTLNMFLRIGLSILKCRNDSL